MNISLDDLDQNKEDTDLVSGQLRTDLKELPEDQEDATQVQPCVAQLVAVITSHDEILLVAVAVAVTVTVNR